MNTLPTNEQIDDAISGSPALKICAFDLIRTAIAHARSPSDFYYDVEVRSTAMVLFAYLLRPRTVEELAKIALEKVA